MANLHNARWGRKLFFEGLLSFRDLSNIAINQFIYYITAAYFWIKSILRGRPGLMIVKSKIRGLKTRKKVLISFVLRPLYKIHFIGRIRYYFSINGLTLYLIRAFNELGYDCHVIHAADTGFKVEDNYQVVVYGDVANFETIHSQVSKSCAQIAFQTGAYWRVHNTKEEERFLELKTRKGADLPYDRWAKNGDRVDGMLKNVSAILALGDYFTRASFKDFSNLYPIESAFLEDPNFDERKILNKDFERAKNNFIYFGGGGEVHKGLDLLIEVFAKLSHLHLYLCNNFSEAFFRIYERELAASPNIHLVGYLPQRSKGFYELINKCAFNIHLSCSEGSPGGVVELLQYGVIPVVSYESNISVKDFGFQLKTHRLEEIINTVQGLSKLPAGKAKELSLNTRHTGNSKFSSAVFLKNLKYVLKEEIKIP